MPRAAWIAALTYLGLTGCANWQPITLHTPDMSWNAAAPSCTLASYQAVPSIDPGRLAR